MLNFLKNMMVGLLQLAIILGCLAALISIPFIFYGVVYGLCWLVCLLFEVLGPFLIVSAIVIYFSVCCYGMGKEARQKGKLWPWEAKK
jgi:hypothetical protein